MSSLKMIWGGLAVLLLAILSFTANADVDAEDFVEEASAKGLAEIETARMALRKGTSPQVKEFAQKMIDDHTAANQELSGIARAKEDWEIADDAELMNKAKAFILRQRDGESFDQAYANNQVVAHEQTIELFREARELRDPELRAFVNKTLPKLETHLRMAKDLAAATGASEADRMNREGVDYNRGVDENRNMNNDRGFNNERGINNDNNVNTRPRPGTTTSPQ
ncbi:DUF4142 domain-containing protein [Cellvibrio sp. ARAG 10.3]|uniref:DUF4142 domain-containing protein n=1 Tax=Cellvibrio sp. ARAG 10.3 TaxID=3451358 RepID=UPI003F4649A1